MITRDDIAAQMETLDNQKRALENNLHGVDGAMQLCRHMLGLIEERETQARVAARSALVPGSVSDEPDDVIA
jgi:hypothetical protein